MSSSFPASFSGEQGAVPGCRDPPGSCWAHAAGATPASWGGDAGFSCGAAPARLGPRGSLRLPFPGLDFKGGVLAGSGTLRNPEGEGELQSVAGGVAPPAPESAVSLLALLAGLGPGRRCGKDMVVYGFA